MELAEEDGRALGSSLCVDSTAPNLHIHDK